MSNQTERDKIIEMIRDYKSGKLHLKGYEFIALSEYLNRDKSSLESN